LYKHNEEDYKNAINEMNSQIEQASKLNEELEQRKQLELYIKTNDWSNKLDTNITDECITELSEEEKCKIRID